MRGSQFVLAWRRHGNRETSAPIRRRREALIAVTRDDHDMGEWIA